MLGKMIMGRWQADGSAKGPLDFPVRMGRDAASDTRVVDVSVRVIRLEANGRSVGTRLLQ